MINWSVEVRNEIDKAHDRWGEWSIGGDRLSNERRYLILSEEVGEVAEALVQQIDSGRFRRGNHSDNLRAELIQVAAVSVAWVELLDREEADARR